MRFSACMCAALEVRSFEVDGREGSLRLRMNLRRFECAIRLNEKAWRGFVFVLILNTEKCSQLSYFNSGSTTHIAQSREVRHCNPSENV